MPGHLFTEYFLTDGIRHTQERRNPSAKRAAAPFVARPAICSRTSANYQRPQRS